MLQLIDAAASFYREGSILLQWILVHVCGVERCKDYAI